MFKSLDSIASVVGIFMYLTIPKFKQVLWSRKGLDYNTDIYTNLFSKGVVKRYKLFFPFYQHLNLSMGLQIE